MTDQDIELIEKIATYMGWHKQKWGNGEEWYGTFRGNPEDNIFILEIKVIDFNPPENLNHAVMVLNKWLDEHKSYDWVMGSNQYNKNEIYFELKSTLQCNMGYRIFVPKNQLARAMCNCLEKVLKE